MYKLRDPDIRQAAKHRSRLANVALFIGVTMGAVSTAPCQAEDLTFVLKNCHATPIDVKVYNENDGAHWFTSSAWYDMQTGQTIGFKCSRIPNGVGRCQAEIKTYDDGGRLGIYYLWPGQSVQCFNFHEDWGELKSGCRC